MSRSAEKMARKMAARLINSAGISKSCGGTAVGDMQFWESVFLPCAEAVVSAGKAITAMNKVLDAHEKRWEQTGVREPRWGEFGEFPKPASPNSAQVSSTLTGTCTPWKTTRRHYG